MSSHFLPQTQDLRSVLEEIEREPGITLSALCFRLGCTEESAHWATRDLLEVKRIRCTGKGLMGDPRRYWLPTHRQSLL